MATFSAWLPKLSITQSLLAIFDKDEVTVLSEITEVATVCANQVCNPLPWRSSGGALLGFEPFLPYSFDCKPEDYTTAPQHFDEYPAVGFS